MIITEKDCELKDKDLYGIDPFDKDLSVDVKKKILTEARNNIHYWFKLILPTLPDNITPRMIDNEHMSFRLRTYHLAQPSNNK